MNIEVSGDMLALSVICFIILLVVLVDALVNVRKANNQVKETLAEVKQARKLFNSLEER